jgi:mevalonate kinase
MSAHGIHWLPACHIRITSTIPMAAGMGSSAAVSIALSRAVSTFLGHPLPDDVINDIAYQVEMRLHGTPSGVDNTVISYARPVYFVRKQPIEFLKVHQQFDLLVADCGITAATGPMVTGVKQHHEEHPEQFEQYFDQIADLVNEARIQLESGSAAKLGPLLTANHQLLQSLGVSVPELDRMVDAALKAGAFGAKLTGR